MWQCIFKFIFHQPTPYAIIAEVQYLECFVSFEAPDDPIDRLLRDLISLDIQLLYLCVAYGPDYLADPLVC